MVAVVTAYKAMHKSSNADTVLVKAAQLVARVDTLPRDTIWVPNVVYRTRIVYRDPVRETPSIMFKDTALMSLPSLDRIGGTKFKDTLLGVDLNDWVQVPREFTLSNENIYLSGSVLATGLRIDSLSVPAKLSVDPLWGRGKGKLPELSISSYNPYITGLTGFRFSVRPYFNNLK